MHKYCKWWVTKNSAETNTSTNIQRVMHQKQKELVETTHQQDDTPVHMLEKDAM